MGDRQTDRERGGRWETDRQTDRQTDRGREPDREERKCVSAHGGDNDGDDDRFSIG